MKSIQFVIDRAKATRTAQAAVAGAWVWQEKSLEAWDSDLAALEASKQLEGAMRVEFEAHIHAWDAKIAEIRGLVRDVVRLGRVHYRAQPVELALFESLKTQARRRSSFKQQALAVRDVWQKTEPSWVPMPGRDLPALRRLLEEFEACETAYGQAMSGWRQSAERLSAQAAGLDADNVAWYAVATTFFPEGTPQGNLIRSVVPTTTALPSQQPVGQAVITHLTLLGGAIHLNCHAPHATRFTYLHQPPGSPQYLVLLADTAERSLTLAEHRPGEHRFKAFGSNALGNGPESEEAVVSVAAALAA